jgi:hypothetical protein
MKGLAGYFGRGDRSAQRFNLDNAGQQHHGPAGLSVQASSYGMEPEG